jgi:hypothetical protein
MIAVHVDGAVRLALVVPILDPITLHLDKLLLNIRFQQGLQLLVYGIQLLVGFQEKFGRAIGPIIGGLRLLATILRRQPGNESKTKNVYRDEPVKHGVSRREEGI